jgi:hypothetical protein
MYLWSASVPNQSSVSKQSEKCTPNQADSAHKDETKLRGYKRKVDNLCGDKYHPNAEREKRGDVG